MQTSMKIKKLTRARFVINALFCFFVLIASVIGFKQLVLQSTKSPCFALAYISIDSVSEHVSHKRINEIVSNIAGGKNLVALDLNPIYEELLQEPWIAKVAIRKRLPDTLELSIIEHEPSAIWKEIGLFDAATRQVFYPGKGFNFPLVKLSAPYDYLASEVYDCAVGLMRILRQHRLQMVAVNLTQIRSYELTLANGTRIILGRNDEKQIVNKRLERFLQAVAQSGLKLAEYEYADLRYDSGFALKPRGGKEIKPKKS